MRGEEAGLTGENLGQPAQRTAVKWGLDLEEYNAVFLKGENT